MADPFRSEYRQLTDIEQEQIQKIKESARQMFNYLGGSNDSRAMALARTKLEECVMWAVKAITG